MIEVRHVTPEEDQRPCANQAWREDVSYEHPAAFEIRVESTSIFICSYDAQLLQRMLQRELLSQ